MLEITGTINKRLMHDQFMDTLDLEQERGITIKLQTARMQWIYNSQNYVLNLIDTPGHVDFAYEVSRSLAACEGAVLLVDATQGIEAQTLSNAFKAIDHNLEIIPVINKIDLPNSEPDRRAKELHDILGFKREEIYFTSGKTGEGVELLLNRIIEKIPNPKDDSSDKLQALIFDSFYDEHKGVIAQIRVVSGLIDQNQLKIDKLLFIQQDAKVEPIEIGYLNPQMIPSQAIFTGEVGYIATGLKDIHKVRVGDTITFDHNRAMELPGYEKAKSMVYAGIYPIDNSEQEIFREALEKLALNDASLNFVPESSVALGFGFRCGFLGLLHMEIVKERLEREYNVDLLITAPSVEYRLKLYGQDNEVIINSPSELPDITTINEIYEPWVDLEIIVPHIYIGQVMKLCQEKRGIYLNVEYIEKNLDEANVSRVIVKYEMPLAEVITDFFDKIKSMTSGYASLDYSLKEYRSGDIKLMTIVVNSEPIDALSILVHESKAENLGRALVEKLKLVIPKHQFKIPIQASIGGRIIARADISALRKDVLKGMYGGDETRKMKKLNKQKKGKERLKKFGKVEIPQDAFLAVLKS